MDHNHHDHHHAPMPKTTGMMKMNHAQHHSLANTTKTMMSMHHDHHADHAGHGSHSMMSMTFHAGFKEQILFEQWSTNTVGGFIGSWIAIFVVAVLYEGLKTVRDQLARRELTKSNEQTNNPSVVQDNDNNLISGVKVEHARGNRVRLLSTYHFLQTFLHILQMGISYLLMLIAMTFNVYLFLAVILGAGLGHLLFGWRRTTILDRNEHCH